MTQIVDLNSSKPVTIRPQVTSPIGSFKGQNVTQVRKQDDSFGLDILFSESVLEFDPVFGDEGYGLDLLFREVEEVVTPSEAKSLKAPATKCKTWTELAHEYAVPLAVAGMGIGLLGAYWAYSIYCAGSQDESGMSKGVMRKFVDSYNYLPEVTIPENLPLFNKEIHTLTTDYNEWHKNVFKPFLNKAEHYIVDPYEGCDDAMHPDFCMMRQKRHIGLINELSYHLNKSSPLCLSLRWCRENHLAKLASFILDYSLESTVSVRRIHK